MLLLVVLDAEALRLRHLLRSRAARRRSCLQGSQLPLSLCLEDEVGDLNHRRGVVEELLSPLFSSWNGLDRLAGRCRVLEQLVWKELGDILVEELERSTYHELSLVGLEHSWQTWHRAGGGLRVLQESSERLNLIRRSRSPEHGCLGHRIATAEQVRGAVAQRREIRLRLRLTAAMSFPRASLAIVTRPHPTRRRGLIHPPAFGVTAPCCVSRVNQVLPEHDGLVLDQSLSIQAELGHPTSQFDVLLDEHVAELSQASRSRR